MHTKLVQQLFSWEDQNQNNNYRTVYWNVTLKADLGKFQKGMKFRRVVIDNDKLILHERTLPVGKFSLKLKAEEVVHV